MGEERKLSFLFKYSVSNVCMCVCVCVLGMYVYNVFSFNWFILLNWTFKPLILGYLLHVCFTVCMILQVTNTHVSFSGFLQILRKSSHRFIKIRFFTWELKYFLNGHILSNRQLQIYRMLVLIPKYLNNQIYNVKMDSNYCITCWFSRNIFIEVCQNLKN